MISHALTIVVNALNHHLTEVYGISANHAPAGLRNLSSVQFPPPPGVESATPECLNLTLVNIQEETVLKNAPRPRHQSGTSYQHPPLQLNLLVLLTATHASYHQALLMLGRAMQFFHSNALLSHGNVSNEILNQYAPPHAGDRLREFRLTLTLYSPTLEESFHAWAALNSPHVPSAWYRLQLHGLVMDSAAETTPIPMIERRIMPGKFNKD